MARHMEKRDEIGEKDGGRGRDGGIGDRENGQRVCETEERGMERDIERDKREGWRERDVERWRDRRERWEE